MLTVTFAIYDVSDLFGFRVTYPLVNDGYIPVLRFRNRLMYI